MEQLEKYFDTAFGAPDGIKKLRELILTLAMQGKLVDQDPTDKPAIELLKAIEKEKSKSVRKPSNIKIQENIEPLINQNDIPSNWAWVRFGNIAQHNSGKTLDGSRNKGIARDYITTSNLYWGRFALTNVRKMLIQDVELERCTARQNDLLICEGGEAGRAAVWENDYEVCFQNHIHRARFYGGINPFYAQKFFEKLNSTREIEQYRKGVGISNMSSKSLASIPFPLPPLKEQNRIVKRINQLMSRCDELEKVRDARNQKRLAVHSAAIRKMLDAQDQETFDEAWLFITRHFGDLYTVWENVAELRKAILQLAVVGKLVKQDEREESAVALLARIKKEKEIMAKKGIIKLPSITTSISDLEKTFILPKSWIWCRLEDICSLITKGSSPKWQGVSYTENPNDVLFITSENVGRYKLLIDSKKYVEKIFNEIEPRSILRKGDYLMNIVGASIGRTAIYDINDIANINQAVCLIRIIPNQLNHEFLLHFFNSSICISYMYDKQVDNARANLSLGNISNFVIPLPPLHEQERIVNKVNSLMQLCESLEKQIEYSYCKKKELLSVMMSDLY